jgi:hypothetical protein
MELRTPGLEIHLHPVGQADAEGWTHVQVEVRVSGFRGRYTAQLQLEDFERFAHELAKMEDGLGRESKAVPRNALSQGSGAARWLAFVRRGSSPPA